MIGEWFPVVFTGVTPGAVGEEQSEAGWPSGHVRRGK